ncbi:MAG: hypothetical protein V3V52_10230 [Candidatus Adiutricales bacterium]
MNFTKIIWERVKGAMGSHGLSARAKTSIIKLARTMADKEAAGEISPRHNSEATRYRSLDRRSGW